MGNMTHGGLQPEDDIKKLQLPKGIENHLRKYAGINSIAQLCAKTQEEVSKIKYIGEQALLEIICTLAHFDFSLSSKY